MPIIAVTNQKGGVGKTTLTYNLCHGLAQQGYSVLAIDNDPQGNLTSSFFEEPTSLPTEANVAQVYEVNAKSEIAPFVLNENLSLLGADIGLSKVSDNGFEVIYQLKEGLEGMEDRYDFILIDCLPSFGYLNLSALNYATHVLIPAKPAPFALAGISDLFETIDKTHRRLNQKLQILGIVLNLVEGRNTSIGKELEQTLRETYQQLVFETVITKGTKLEESPAFTQSIYDYAPRSKQAGQMTSLVKELLMRIQNL